MSSEVKIYFDGTLVSSAQVMSGKVIETYASMYVSGGGTAEQTTIVDGGVFVSAGGSANLTTVNGGCLQVDSGGTAAGIVENGGWVGFDPGACVTFLLNTFGGSNISGAATLHSGTTTVDITVDGRVSVYDGGMAVDAAVNSAVL